jgi:phenylalanyl-tRNA synthetase beta chain
LPKFPPIERDLALVLHENIATASVIDELRNSNPRLVESVKVFDIYQGDQIEEGHKSLAFAIRLRDHKRTLQDVQADKAIAKMLKAVEEKFGARLR